MFKSKGSIIYICLTLMLILFTTACGSGNNSGTAGSNSNGSAGTVQLTMWQQWGNGHEKEVLDSVISQFENANPGIKITETAFSSNDNAKILTSIAGGNPPDILDLGSTNVIGEWAAKGALTALDDYIAKDKINKDKFIPASWKAVTYNGKVYAMPFVAFNEGFLYNKTMFKEAGIDPEKPPKTFDELLAYNDKLTKVDASGKILQMGFVPNWPSSHIATSLGWQAGAGYYNAKENKITVNEPAIAAILEFERKFYAKYNPQEVQNFVSSGGAYLTAQDLFESGKLAMCIDGSWVIRFIQENVPKLDPNIGAAYIPTADDHTDLYGTSFIDVNPQIIPNGAKHPEEAWKFISWETTDEKISSTFSDLVANVPQLKDAPTTDLLKDPRFKVFIDLAGSDKAKVFPVIPISNEYTTKLADLENKVLLDPSLDIKSLLDKLNDELNASLQQAKQ